MHLKEQMTTGLKGNLSIKLNVNITYDQPLLYSLSGASFFALRNRCTKWSWVCSNSAWMWTMASTYLWESVRVAFNNLSRKGMVFEFTTNYHETSRKLPSRSQSSISFSFLSKRPVSFRILHSRIWSRWRVVGSRDLLQYVSRRFENCRIWPLPELGEMDKYRCELLWIHLKWDAPINKFNSGKSRGSETSRRFEWITLVTSNLDSTNDSNRYFWYWHKIWNFREFSLNTWMET